MNKLKNHWPEYAMEAAELALFMISACVFGTLLGHPDSPIVQSIGNPFLLRIFMGSAMGLTAILIIYSPLGKRSGAHFNPVVTFTFWRLKKIETSDAAYYIAAQFIGGIVGVMIASQFIGKAVGNPNVHYVATLPGVNWGLHSAFVAEVIISFFLMTMVLHASNSKRFMRYTGVFAGMMIATYIIIESPISGMSMNPARTLGSAIPAKEWSTLWIYFIAPLAGMLSAAQVFTLIRKKPMCAKLHHNNKHRCIFRCEYKTAEELNDQKHPIANERMRA